MLGKIKNKISYQLILLLIVSTFSLIIPVGYTAWQTVSNFGEYASTVNQEHLRKQAYDSLINTTREQSLRYDSYLEKVRVTASILAAQAGNIYDLYVESDEILTVPFILCENPKNGMFLSGIEEEVMTVYWGEKTVDTAAFKEIAALTKMDPILIAAKRELPESAASHMITVSGIGKYFPDDKQISKMVYELPHPEEFDLRDGAPFTIFAQDASPEKTAKWTPIYKDDVHEGLMVTASGPIYNKKNQFMGIAGIDVQLNRLNSEISAINTKTSDVAVHFILDEKGRLIGFPKEKNDQFGLTVDTSEFRYSSHTLELSLLNSNLPEIQQLHPQIVGQPKSLSFFIIDDQQHVAASFQMGNIGWHMVTVINEEKLFESINQTNVSFSVTLEQLKRKYIYLFLVIGLGVLFLIFLLVKRYVAPLQVLNETALQIRDGDFSARCPVNRRDELGMVAASMNDMAQELGRMDRIKQSYTVSLEELVAERVKDLAKKNIELEEVIFRLNEESGKRQLATEALKENEERLRSITEFSLAALTVTQDNQLKYFNNGFLKMGGYSLEDMSASFTFEDFVVPEDVPIIHKKLERRLAGETGDPYQIRGRKKDGSVAHVLIEGSLITWEGRPAALGTMIDITNLKETENMLQQSLEEKEVLLKEVYHRTKNNMLVIISLLNLQMDEIDDPKMKRIFKETENRIRAMALIHESLYQTHNLAQIDAGQYVSNIAAGLIESMTLKNRISLELDCAPIIVSIDKAMPLGLIANEIITNAIQHAFADDEQGKIFIELKKHSAEDVVLIIGDDGTGWDSQEKMNDPDQFGLMVIRNLIDMQLQGNYTIKSDDGTCYAISFKDDVDS